MIDGDFSFMIRLFLKSSIMNFGETFSLLSMLSHNFLDNFIFEGVMRNFLKLGTDAILK